MTRIGLPRNFASGINRPQHHLHRTAQPPIPSIGHNVTRWIQRSPDDYIKHVQDSTKFPKAGAAKQGEIIQKAIQHTHALGQRWMQRGYLPLFRMK
ncbi:hypothetical protein BASA61_003955 [Batrachochytrium salamandrivorans]|nr:hypothetical protein BASA61_003955 [Batrachochytrium salamandrivorans]